MSFSQSVFPLNMVQGHNLSAHIPPLQHNSRTLLLPVLTPASVAKHAMDHLHLVTLHVMVLITCQHHSGIQRTVWYLWAVYHEWCMCTIKVCNQSRAIQCSSSNIVLWVTASDLISVLNTYTESMHHLQNILTCLECHGAHSEASQLATIIGHHPLLYALCPMLNGYLTSALMTQAWPYIACQELMPFVAHDGGPCTCYRCFGWLLYCINCPCHTRWSREGMWGSGAMLARCYLLPGSFAWAWSPLQGFPSCFRDSPMPHCLRVVTDWRLVVCILVW